VQILSAIYLFGMIAARQGNPDRALELFGLAQGHAAFNIDDRRHIDQAIADMGLDPEAVAAGLARGAALDLAATVAALLALDDPPRSR
jgi:hypothetical protein